MRERIGHYNAVTNLTLEETFDTSPWVDVVWWAADESSFRTTSVLADVTCPRTLANNRCDSFHLKFNEDNYFGRTDLQQDHTVCHELAHTIGSDDGSTSPWGCFPQSRFSSGRFLTSNEQTVINNHYDLPTGGPQ